MPFSPAHFTTERRLDDGVLERGFAIDGIPGTLWTPPTTPAPLILAGHPGGLQSMHPRLEARARSAATSGFATATIELPGSGNRDPLPDVDHARTELRAALAAGRPVTEDIIDRLVLPLVDRAVPELQATIDALLTLPDVDGPVGYSGGVTAIGVRLTLVEPRIAALGLFAGSYLPRATLQEARKVDVPVHVLMQWDDAWNDRQRALELFDALGSQEKTLQANMGGHTGVPPHAGEDAGRFFARHLRVTLPQ
ncbi:dienelactone hydrolase family protein [Gordonia sp. GN26]